MAPVCVGFLLLAMGSLPWSMVNMPGVTWLKETDFSSLSSRSSQMPVILHGSSFTVGLHGHLFLHTGFSLAWRGGPGHVLTVCAFVHVSGLLCPETASFQPPTSSGSSIDPWALTGGLWYGHPMGSHSCGDQLWVSAWIIVYCESFSGERRLCSALWVQRSVIRNHFIAMTF